MILLILHIVISMVVVIHVCFTAEEITYSAALLVIIFSPLLGLVIYPALIFHAVKWISKKVKK